MQNCKWKTELVTLGIAVVALASSLAPSKAQAQENFAWITNTNGVTWKKSISGYGSLDAFKPSERDQIAEIVVPEHALLDKIDVVACVNLTNIIFRPATAQHSGVGETNLSIQAGDSGLRTITCQKTLRDRIFISQARAGFHEGGWWSREWSVQWIELNELPQIEIRTLATANGPELEVIWREGNLQIADAVSGEWRDHIGNSPLIFPLAVTKPQQFFRIRRSR